MTKKKASKSSIGKKAKQPHRAVKVAKHKVVAAENFSQKLSTAPLQSKKKKRTKKPRRSNETNSSLFGAVGKSSVKVKKIRNQQQQQELSQTPAVVAVSTKLPKSSSAEKMNNKKKKKKAVLLITKNDASKNVKRKKRREASQQQKQRKGKGETSSHHSNYQQQRGRIKIFQLPRSNESRKLSQSPWFSHSHLPPPPLSTTSSPTAPCKCRLPYQFLVESMDHDAACWDWLDYELQLFAQYVRLQQVEIQARDNAISQIRNLALDLFRKNVSQNNTRRLWGSSNSKKADRFEEADQDADDESQIRVEAFGSYAAQPVCCFQSDIDLALWGVVAPPKQAPTHYHLSATTSRTAASGVDGDAANSFSPAKVDKKKRQEERIQRWKQALATLNDAKQKQQQLQDEVRNENPEVAETVVVAKDAKQDNPSRSEDKESSTETKEKESLKLNPPNPKRRKMSASGSDRPEFFFVLDRTGVEELGGSPLRVTQSEPSDNLTSDQVTAEDDEVQKCAVDFSANIGGGNGDTANATLPSDAIVKPTSIDLFAMGIPCMDGSINNYHLEDSQLLTKENTEAVEAEAVSTKTQPRDDTQGKGAPKSDSVDLTQDDCLYEGETIDLTFEGGSCSERETSDSDDDSADKMSAFNPQGDLVDVDDDSGNEFAAVNDQREFIDSDDESAEKMSPLTPFNRREDRDDLISLSSSTTSNSDDDELDESGLEVSFVSSARSDTSKRSNDFGPKGHMKQQVVSALVRLGNALRKRSWTHRLEIRKHARVPIINMTTATGFESDIALGGHTGVDTRLYATTLASRYDSFSPVVLALKILLNQQGLDQPFTGGLGSYKLYVLVAHHVEKHLAKGGSDRPGEVLVSFLFRYGVPNKVASTDLSSVVEVESHGGTADMNAVYKVEHCMELFRNCWYRLNARIREWDMEDHHENRPSFLAPLLRAEDLQRQRNQCLQQALTWKAFANDKKGSRSKFGGIQATIPASAAASKRKAEGSNYQQTPTDMDEPVDDETEAERLIRGYGLERGPDGRLVSIEA